MGEEVAYPESPHDILCIYPLPRHWQRHLEKGKRKMMKRRRRREREEDVGFDGDGSREASHRRPSSQSLMSSRLHEKWEATTY